MAKIYDSITSLVGHTPLFEPKNIEKKYNLNARILLKLEYYNPAQSVKDRIAYAMIEKAEKEGKLKSGYTIVEVTSGNTGIGLAAVAASKGYKFRVYIADDVSEERFKVIHAFGGETVKLSTVPAIQKTLEETNGDFQAAVRALQREVISKEEKVFFTNQSTNEANWKIHFETTGPEIWEDSDGKVDIFVSNIGTGGTLTGTSRFLKSKNSGLKVVALEPTPQSLPSKENPNPEQITGVHPYDGLPKEMLPEILDVSLIDEKYVIDTKQAYKACRELAKSDGILLGTSGGASLYAAIDIAQRPENAGKTIVAVAPDTGLRYLSTNLYNEDFEV
ncbi:PLP-dependent cysteine synthase family protein [Treponema sp.]|uniref:PLP-dependent cysteine synthase family protein n=1 Tax=Treponema sp. TaxID=166 RepID=UPI003F063727